MGKKKSSHAVGEDQDSPASAMGDEEGRMWSLFPQTSSGNLNNSLYLPLAAPGIRLLELRDRRTTLPLGSREPSGSQAPPSPARSSPAPAAPRGPEPFSGPLGEHSCITPSKNYQFLFPQAIDNITNYTIFNTDVIFLTFQ